MRVATFNVHHCRGLDRRVDIERIAAVIRGLDPDLLALQELDRGMPRSGRIDQPAELARLTGMTFQFQPTLARDGGEFGIAIATGSESHGAFDFTALPRVADEEPRGYLSGRWQGITVVGTHIHPRGRPRVVQTKALIEAVDAIRGPFLWLGDLNQSLWRLAWAVRGRFWVGWKPHRTMARHNTQRDHIVGGGGVRIVRRFARPTDASDHYPLAADIEVA